jgi:hypothetical protein
VSWNGATGVERWNVLAGADTQHLRRAATHAKTGFETAIPFRGSRGYVEVEAVARNGDVLATSAMLRR